MNRIALIVLAVAWQPALAGGPAGGKAAAMGGASVTDADLWSAFHNQAGLAGIDRVTAGIFDHTPFLLKELSTRGLAVAVPAGDGVLAASLSYYGYSLYNEKQAGLAYARPFGERFSAGLQLEYLSTSISEGYGKGGAVTFEMGFRAEVVPHLFLGAHVFNPMQVKRSGTTEEAVPTVLNAGLSYVPSDKVQIAVESEKELQQPHRFMAGLEYRPVKALFLRAGVSTRPVQTAFGAGIVIDAFRLDIGSGYHPQLGYSPNVSLTYRFE